jgi:hypothetical protein|tara:strand:- start:1121 stop:3127 length:2007 start_codon:yes stop_codon:yes gene_type:complete
MRHWVMDYETLYDCFTGVFENYKTTETKIFVISRLRNDQTEFISFLKENIKNKEWHISYNGLAFDAQVTHYILDNVNNWKDKEGLDLDGHLVANIIYKYAQRCIQRSNNKEFSDYPAWKMKMGQIDVFKLHHWDNPAKRSSLKWIQYSMDWQNILDMPIHHETEIRTQEDLDTILEYCINDVKSTKEIYNRSKSQVGLRKELTKTYDINMFSASEPRISKEIFGYYLSKNLNIPKRDLKQMRTYRDTIKVKDIILPYVSFTSPEFKLLHERFKSLEIDASKLKGSFKYHINYKDVKTHFGLGGAHGATAKGIYESTDDMLIMSSDVTSFYPNLAIKNQWSPGHFPKEAFSDQYEWFFEERKKIPKSNPMNYVYKIILNSTFGLSNDVNSFFYDPELCMRITINGQLTLMMLYEQIMERIPGAIALLQNTDGVETIIPKQYYELYMEICEEWEHTTSLNLEHDQYQKLVLSDVNNYIGVNNYVNVDITKWREVKQKQPHYLFKVDNDKFSFAPVKLKGRFDFQDLQLHKNKSKLVIPKALYQYFVNDVLPEEYLEENKNILDYCIGGKSKGQWQQVARSIENGSFKEEKLQKINRYFISKQGVKIIKVNKDDAREIQLEAGRWVQTVFNKMDVKPKWELYNIDKLYYLQAIESEINNILSINTNQLKLF